MAKQYIALFEDDPEVKGFGVVFPDFPGCVSQGDNYEDAVRIAHEALAFHIQGMKEDGEPIPEPRTLEQIKETWEDWDDWKKNCDFTVEHIAVLPSTPASKRFNITMDETLLHRIDRVARNRSAFLAEAARRMLDGTV